MLLWALSAQAGSDNLQTVLVRDSDALLELTEELCNQPGYVHVLLARLLSHYGRLLTAITLLRSFSLSSFFSLQL